MIYVNKRREQLLFVYSPRLRDALLEANQKVLDIRINNNNGRIYWLFEKNAETEKVMCAISHKEEV